MCGIRVLATSPDESNSIGTDGGHRLCILWMLSQVAATASPVHWFAAASFAAGPI